MRPLCATRAAIAASSAWWSSRATWRPWSGRATYRGLYHVLHGRLAPLDNIGPEQLTVESLVERVRQGDVQEIIMATNPTLEGDGTALTSRTFWPAPGCGSRGWRAVALRLGAGVRQQPDAGRCPGRAASVLKNMESLTSGPGATGPDLSTAPVSSVIERRIGHATRYAA